MIRKKVQIVNKLGLHARAAAKFVQTASQYASEIELFGNGRTVNGRSIMGVMMLAASKDTWLEIVASGTDEDSALADLEKLICERFGEST